MSSTRFTRDERERERDQWGGEFYSCTMAENLEGANFNLVCISDHFRAAMNLDQKPALEWHWKYTKICLKSVLNPIALSENFLPLNESGKDENRDPQWTCHNL